MTEHLARRMRDRDDGYALVVTMLLLAIMTVLMVVSLQAGESALRRSQEGIRWTRALTLAEAGVQAFPFAKRGAIRASLDEMGRWLDAGYAVIISPEGDSEPDGKLLPFLGGTGLMAVEMQVPVVPFRLEGYHRLFAPNVPFPYLPERRGRVRLIVGEPVSFPPGTPYEEATRRLEQVMSTLQ